jgi:hypothetical protein
VFGASYGLLVPPQGDLVPTDVDIGVGDRVLEGREGTVGLAEHLEGMQMVRYREPVLDHGGFGHSAPSERSTPASTCACTWKTDWPARGPVLKIRRNCPSARSSATWRADVDHVGQQCRVRAELRDVPPMLTGHDEHVHGRLGRLVRERHDTLVLVHTVRGDVAGDDLAEDAVGVSRCHDSILRARAPGPCEKHHTLQGSHEPRWWTII